MPQAAPTEEPLRHYHGAPCLRLRSWLHADLTTRWPYGGSLSLTWRGYSVLLDLNAPFGEPNRLHLTLPRWHVVIGLLTWHEFRMTGRQGRTIEGYYARCRPRPEKIWRDGRYRWLSISRPRSEAV